MDKLYHVKGFKKKVHGVEIQNNTRFFHKNNQQRELLKMYLKVWRWKNIGPYALKQRKRKRNLKIHKYKELQSRRAGERGYCGKTDFGWSKMKNNQTVQPPKRLSK